MRLLYSFLSAVFFLLLSHPAIAETLRAGTVAQVVKESDVLKDPTDRGSSYGKLPAGTLLTLTGEKSGSYVGVEVELEDGDLEGWIRRDAIEKDDSVDNAPPSKSKKKKKSRRGEEDDEDADEVDDSSRKRGRRRVLVPKDEGLLLRRETSFFYGLQAGGNFSILNDDFGTLYVGPGFTAGGHVGYYFSKEFPVRAEANYSYLTGTALDGGGIPAGTLLTFGFFDMSVSLQYLVSGFELFGTVQYSYGMSINDIPTKIRIVSPADLSSLWIGGGAGYRVPLGEIMDLVIRGRYGVSLLRAPVGFQTFSLGAFLEFSG